MNNYQTQQKQWDKRWSFPGREGGISPIGRIMFKSKLKALADIVLKLDIETVIEVGCGLGYTLDFYQKNGFESIGIDSSKKAVMHCRKRNLPVIEKRLEAVTDQFDLVSSDGLLEHYLDFRPFARHMMRISRKYVLLIQPNHGSFWGKTLVYLSEILKKDKNVFEYNFKIDDFVSVFSQGNFSVVENIPVFGDVFRILLFERKQA